MYTYIRSLTEKYYIENLCIEPVHISKHFSEYFFHGWILNMLSWCYLNDIPIT
jgi:hypothetical protein